MNLYAFNNIVKPHTLKMVLVAVSLLFSTSVFAESVTDHDCNDGHCSQYVVSNDSYQQHDNNDYNHHHNGDCNHHSNDDCNHHHNDDCNHHNNNDCNHHHNGDCGHHGNCNHNQ